MIFAHELLLVVILSEAKYLSTPPSQANPQVLRFAQDDNVNYPQVYETHR
jgi:hypothetical protein